MARRIAALIFDMDGLMLDTQRLARRAWRRACADWGYALTDEVYLQVVGRTVRDAEAVYRAAFGAEFDFPAIFQRRLAYLDEIMRTEGVPVKPGLLELLDTAERLALPKAVATSTVRSLAEERLAIAGLLHRFAAVVCGDEVTAGKPAPDIFLAAADRLGVAPAACLVLEDAVAGIEAAHAAGMAAILVPDLQAPTPAVAALADAVVDTLHEAIPLVAAMAGGRAGPGA